MPMVVFAITARIKLEQRLARAMAMKSDALEKKMNEIEQALQQVFPAGAKVAIVQDLYSGFRIREGEHILLVEVANSGDLDGLSVVKLGPHGELAKEWDAWHTCRPHGLRHDIVLMDLRRVPDAGDPIAALVYADAEQLIGVDQTVLLERALLDAVRLGEPTAESVADVLFQLYERLGLLLYRHADDEDPLAPDYRFDANRLDRNLAKNLEIWADESRQAFLTRSSITTAIDDLGLSESFQDPAFMVSWIIQQPRAGTHLPRMLRGRSHGDLHGRNVLVGRIGNRVIWPAVFDYGNMGRDNLVGWDFVKMEAEFKLRAYRSLFPGERFVESVIRTEVEMFQATEQSRNSGHFPELPSGAVPLERFRWLVQTIRRLAGGHLSYRNRSMLWLHEYYFLLAVYGLNAGRFENLTPIEQTSAYLCAGAAADRFSDTFRQRTPAKETR